MTEQVRVCGSCKTPRPLSMFYLEQERRRAEKRGWSKRLLACRVCKRAEMKRYQQSANSNREFINQYKVEHGCADCGLVEADHPEIYDFDHLSDKTCNIARMVNRSMKSLLAEIAKCEVVCANCHRKRTRARREILVPDL